MGGLASAYWCSTQVTTMGFQDDSSMGRLKPFRPLHDQGSVHVQRLLTVSRRRMLPWVLVSVRS